MRAAAPAARKPTCLSRPVIRADGEFWKCGSLRSEGRICVNPCEFNAVRRGMPHAFGQVPDALLSPVISPVQKLSKEPSR